MMAPEQGDNRRQAVEHEDDQQEDAQGEALICPCSPSSRPRLQGLS